MATRYWGLNKGQKYTDVVEGSSTGTKDVELTLNLASSLTRLEVLLAVNAIIQVILKDVWPPA